MSEFQFFHIEIDQGVALVTFERPPANAFSYAVYRDIIRLADDLENNDAVRAVVFAGSPRCKAWIGGADVNDFVGLDYQSRLDRYDLVNQANDAFFKLTRPVVAAIGSHAVGAGMTFAAICDIRVAAENVIFSMPEIDRGTTSGGGLAFTRLNMPIGKMREMLFTGRRFRTEELADTGFFNYILPSAQVLDKSLEIARLMATKNLEAIRATKICINAAETLPRPEGRRLSQEYSAQLTSSSAGKEGMRAFLEKREADYGHNNKPG